MPIVIPRTEAATAAPEIPQSYRDGLWEQLIRNYAANHPEIFNEPQEKSDS